MDETRRPEGLDEGDPCGDPPRVLRPMLSCVPGISALAQHVIYQWTDRVPEFFGYAFFGLLVAGVGLAAWFVWTYRRLSRGARSPLVRGALAAHIVVLIFGGPVVFLVVGEFLVERFKL